MAFPLVPITETDRGESRNIYSLLFFRGDTRRVQASCSGKGVRIRRRPYAIATRESVAGVIRGWSPFVHNPRVQTWSAEQSAGRTALGTVPLASTISLAA